MQVVLHVGGIDPARGVCNVPIPIERAGVNNTTVRALPLHGGRFPFFLLRRVRTCVWVWLKIRENR